ncbi:MAG: hypothetical protein A3G27_01185 [Betaproteobacteria bacterium RIFCSPLOWO2_12_FULL_66_14]|nr:MAG: hypothetical protein A3G27_01185 [Betaproteobacteria bacterium RIFCSPLOWO2_12_FULL_66_14]
MLVVAVLSLAAAGCKQKTFPVTPPARTGISRAVIEPYLKIQASLANDTTDDIRANAGTIATAATALGAPATKIDTAALRLAAAAEAATPDMADVRDKFGMLSEAIDTYMTGLKLAPPDGVKVAFCAMAHRPWMQVGETLANPYYGKAMPTCGSFR